MLTDIGIGPTATLTEQSIEVVSDLSGVGQNMQDQVFFNVFRGISVKGTASYLLSPEQQAIAGEEWSSNASGPLSAAGGYLSFEKLPEHLRKELSNRTVAKLAEFPSDWPEIEYLPTGFPFGDLPYTFGGISAILLTPSSRGSVTINSSSIKEQPVIDLGWLTDPADEETLVAAFKRVREAWNSPAIAEIVVSPELVPGETVSSDEDILSFIRGAAQPLWHASSTCSMGKSAEDGAVVDSKAKVFGVNGLRVVDASVIPFCLPGHPQSSVYMLAEKIAEDILKKM
jgi:choline dehydrogenase